MRNETLAIHAGYEPDPTTHAVAVPIYQTASYAFDSADHGAALFNLETEGYRYSRIANPTTSVLEKRVAELEGGVGALAVASGQAALHFAFVNLADHGGNIVSVPQLYGTTHTLLSHILPRQGITGRFAASDKPDDIAKLIDEGTRAVFCETIGNPAGNVCDIEAIADVAHRAGVPLIVDNTVATPILFKPIAYGADVVVHSLTKFLGGHGTTLGGAIVDSGRFDWAKQPERFPAFNQPDHSYHGMVYAERFGRPLTSSVRGRSISAPWDLCCRRLTPFCCCRASRQSRCGWSATSRTPAKSPNSCATIRALPGSITPASRTARIIRWCRSISTAARRRCSPSASREAWKPARRSTIRSS